MKDWSRTGFQHVLQCLGLRCSCFRSSEVFGTVPMTSKSWFSYLVPLKLPCPHCSEYAWKDPVLCFPHRYLRMLGPMPTEPRPLVPVKPAKRVDYLQLASLLLTRAPSESTARSVEFLVSCQVFTNGGKALVSSNGFKSGSHLPQWDFCETRVGESYSHGHSVKDLRHGPPDR